jgi:sugar (pentulose or hexulose) kinase
LKEHVDLYEFNSPEEAYHELMNELCDLTIEAIHMVLPSNDDIENIFITGGFSKNDLFLNLITEAYPSKLVYTSEISNASALGAALVVSGSESPLNLGLTRCSN